MALPSPKPNLACDPKLDAENEKEKTLNAIWWSQEEKLKHKITNEAFILGI